MSAPVRLGIVIPTLNEAAHLPHLLGDLAQLAIDRRIVVADGGSTDGTAELARAAGATVVTSPPGRGIQLNAGAAAIEAEWLCFLHADVRVPPGARTALVDAVAREVDIGVWRLRIDTPARWARLMEAGARIRARLGGLPYGDQGLVVRRSVFETAGGFPNLPIMEDVALIRTLRRKRPVERFRADVLVSPRRWVREGPYRTWMRNSLLLSAFLCGVPPATLARWYRPEPA